MVSEMEWTRYIQEDPRCPHLRKRPPSAVSIFRVPKFLKDTKREAYVPQRVSLGPYHHASAELPPMGHHKGRAVRTMMTRFNRNLFAGCAMAEILQLENEMFDIAIDMDFADRAMAEIVQLENEIRDPYNINMDFANRAKEEILKLENEIRDSYEEDIDCDGETLARMLCLDGCFLLEVLRTLAGDTLSRAESRMYYDPIFGGRKLNYAAQDVRNDLLILENQIPLIVLIKLLELESNSAVDVEKKLLDVVKGTLSILNPFDNKNFDIEKCSRHHHLLGLLHTLITSPASNECERVDEGKCSISIDCCCSSKCISMLQGKSKARNDSKAKAKQRISMLQGKSKARKVADHIIPHAVELRNAGIKFSPLLQGGITDIKFDENSATFFLPPITIYDQTERVMRNLIAYEMCKPFKINYVSCYVALMNDLIDTEQDVALMRRMGVMSNWLGSDKEVADLFNGLGKEVIVKMGDVFDKLTEKVNAHYNNEMKVQIGKLMQDHFSSPWKALALTAASVILVLTVLQTIFTIISTYKK